MLWVGLTWAQPEHFGPCRRSRDHHPDGRHPTAFVGSCAGQGPISLGYGPGEPDLSVQPHEYPTNLLRPLLPHVRDVVRCDGGQLVGAARAGRGRDGAGSAGRVGRAGGRSRRDRSAFDGFRPCHAMPARSRLMEINASFGIAATEIGTARCRRSERASEATADCWHDSPRPDGCGRVVRHAPVYLHWTISPSCLPVQVRSGSVRDLTVNVRRTVVSRSSIVDASNASWCWLGSANIG